MEKEQTEGGEGDILALKGQTIGPDNLVLSVSPFPSKSGNKNFIVYSTQGDRPVEKVFFSLRKLNGPEELPMSLKNSFQSLTKSYY